MQRRTPYLDRLAVSSHTPCGDDSEHHNLLIQPVSIGDISHTGIKTALSPASPSLILPDGKSRTAVFKGQVQEGYKTFKRYMRPPPALYNAKLKKMATSLTDDVRDDLDEDIIDAEEHLSALRKSGAPKSTIKLAKSRLMNLKKRRATVRVNF